MRKIILVTGIGGDIGQSIIKCLKDTRGDLYFIGIDVDFYAAGKKEVKKFFVAPWANVTQEYLNFIDSLIESEGIKYIFPATEPEIQFYDDHRDYFDNKKVITFINRPNIIKTFFDKYETVNFLKKNNLPYPRTYLLEDHNHELPFPLILKSKKGWGSKGLRIINDNEELLFFKKRIKDALIQEIVGDIDEEYTVGLFSTGQDIYSIAFKRRLGYGSLTKVAQLVEDREISSLAEKIAQLSYLEGSLNLQLRKTDRGYVPIEINPRFSSTVYLRHFFGFQDVKWWLDLKEKKEIKFKLRYKHGVAVRCINEVFFELDRL